MSRKYIQSHSAFCSFCDFSRLRILYLIGRCCHKCRFKCWYVGEILIKTDHLDLQKVSGYNLCCRGSIIDRQNFLTVAHSIERWKAKDFKVWVEDHSIRASDVESPHAVCGITKHPEYRKSNTYKHDIPILHLCEHEHLTFRNGKFYIS